MAVTMWRPPQHHPLSRRESREPELPLDAIFFGCRKASAVRVKPVPTALAGLSCKSQNRFGQKKSRPWWAAPKSMNLNDYVRSHCPLGPPREYQVPPYRSSGRFVRTYSARRNGASNSSCLATQLYGCGLDKPRGFPFPGRPIGRRNNKSRNAPMWGATAAANIAQA